MASLPPGIQAPELLIKGQLGPLVVERLSGHLGRSASPCRHGSTVRLDAPWPGKPWLTSTFTAEKDAMSFSRTGSPVSMKDVSQFVWGLNS